MVPLGDKGAAIYQGFTPDMALRLDQLLSEPLGSLTGGFLGRLVETTEEAQRGDDPTALLRDGNGPTFGVCGQCGACATAGVLECYVCPTFQAWQDGPHERILLELLDWRTAAVEVGDLHLAKSKDLLIAAVVEVVRRCRDAKEART